MIKNTSLLIALICGLLTFSARAQDVEPDTPPAENTSESVLERPKKEKGKDEREFGKPVRRTNLQEKEGTWKDLHNARKKQKNTLKEKGKVRKRSQWGPVRKSSGEEKKQKVRPKPMRKVKSNEED